jgi:hypothetical protein
MSQMLISRVAVSVQATTANSGGSIPANAMVFLGALGLLIVGRDAAAMLERQALQ